MAVYIAANICFIYLELIEEAMFCILCVLRKPKTKRSKRFVESRVPKLTEDVKSAMIMKGGNTSETVTQALKDIVRTCNCNIYM